MVMSMRTEHQACIVFFAPVSCVLSSSSDWSICLFSEFAGFPLILVSTKSLAIDDQCIRFIRDCCLHFHVTGIIATVAEKKLSERQFVLPLTDVQSLRLRVEKAKLSFSQKTG